MKLMVLILNKTEKLDELLREMSLGGIKGSTILSSKGMAMELKGSDIEDIPFLFSLRSLLNENKSENKTILTVLKADMVATAVEIIESVIGELSQPNTGIVFTLDIDYLKGTSI